MIKSVFATTIETWVGILVIIFITVSLTIIIFSKINSLNNYIDSLNQEDILLLSRQEINRIEKWIKDNDLNKYGDPADTFYIGGTPLFDEKTGEKISRFNYIAKKYPDKPWR
ncbi:MAG: hypothetical protein US76_01010 [Parcubacteria group bacterium GW2011_GWA2_38_13b]|nr:MAG: hypothetical protein US76_01010 [Parcubacteria group bacterium GW2011_GWA2_38_13b]